MVLLLEKLLQSSETGIDLLLARAVLMVQVFATAAAETFAIGLAQQLGTKVQDEYRPDNVFQICIVAFQRKYPLIFVFFVTQLCDQHHIYGESHLLIEIRSAAIAHTMNGSFDRACHHQYTSGISYHTGGTNRLTDWLALAIKKITQIYIYRERD